MSKPAIGIIGGMGPQAGVYLAECITAETVASGDAEHLPLALLSLPADIADRSAYLHGHGPSPSPGILGVAEALVGIGSRVLGMPCNTAHAAAILDPVLEQLGSRHPETRFLHLIKETAAFCREVAPGATHIGVLATMGTYQQGLYEAALTAEGLTPVDPDEAVQRELVHKAIYDPEFGIKSRSAPVTEEAIELLTMATEHLVEAGAQAVILGCTELPLAVPGPTFAGLPTIDSTTALARALIRAVDPTRLRPTN